MCDLRGWTHPHSHYTKQTIPSHPTSPWNLNKISLKPSNLYHAWIATNLTCIFSYLSNNQNCLYTFKDGKTEKYEVVSHPALFLKTTPSYYPAKLAVIERKLCLLLIIHRFLEKDWAPTIFTFLTSFLQVKGNLYLSCYLHIFPTQRK